MRTIYYAFFVGLLLNRLSVSALAQAQNAPDTNVTYAPVVQCNTNADCGADKECYQPPMRGLLTPARACRVKTKYALVGEACGLPGMKACTPGLICKISAPNQNSTGSSVGQELMGGVCAKPAVRPTPTVHPTVTPPTTPTPTGDPNFSPTPTPTGIETGLQGDANGDGKVDLADFTIWKGEYAGGLASMMADFDKSGKVDLADFAIWKVSYLQPELL